MKKTEKGGKEVKVKERSRRRTDTRCVMGSASINQHGTFRFAHRTDPTHQVIHTRMGV